MLFHSMQVTAGLVIYLFVSGDIVADDIRIRDICRYGRYFAFWWIGFFWYYRFVSIIILISVRISIVVTSILK